MWKIHKKCYKFTKILNKNHNVTISHFLWISHKILLLFHIHPLAKMWIPHTEMLFSNKRCELSSFWTKISKCYFATKAKMWIPNKMLKNFIEKICAKCLTNCLDCAIIWIQKDKKRSNYETLWHHEASRNRADGALWVLWKRKTLGGSRPSRLLPTST